MKTLILLISLLTSGCNNTANISDPPTPNPAPTAISNPNLMCDGSFENIYSGSTWEVFDHLSLPANCWTIKDHAAGLEIQNSGVVKPSVHGNYIAELDSHILYGLTKTNVEIYQLINTIPGKSYELTFYYAARTSNSSSNLEVTIAEANGTQFTTNFSKVYSAPNSIFVKYSVKFVATTCKTYVSFKGVGNEDSLGALLDAVVLKRYVPNCNCD